MDSFDKIEEYMESLEEYFFSSLAAATTDLPNIHDAVNRLWVDIARYGPGMPAFPEVRIAGLGEFEVPPPPSPLHSSASSGWIARSAGWVGQNPWKTTGVIIGVVGTGLLVGYRLRSGQRKHAYRSTGASSERRQVVVVLGGDMPIALPLILDLEKKGYIVIASVATPDAVENLEHECQGYVRALVLDPHEPATIPIFLRSLASTLSRRFPLTAAGDPYVSPASLPYVHSVISLLALPEPVSHICAPMESISLRSTYLSHLGATHLTPLQVIQALLPLLRTGPARSRDKGKKSIIVCLPAIDARVGLPFSAVQAMTAASTLRGLEVLRREINAAALTGKSEAMKNIKVVVVDVGVLNVETQSEVQREESVYKSMEDWTASEKVTYGPAFAAMTHNAPLRPTNYWCSFFTLFKDSHQYQPQREPANINVFVDSIVTVVSGGRFGPTILGLHLGRIRNWIRGERFSVGAGASTYRLASHLPAFLLDSLLNLPHILISIRNALLPTAPFVVSPSRRSTLRSPFAPTTSTSHLDEAGSDAAHDLAHAASENDQSDTASEMDVESNSGASGTDSWTGDHIDALIQFRTPRFDNNGSRILFLPGPKKYRRFEPMGVALWLVPPSEGITLLRNVMKLRPKSHPSAKSYPNFVPHITLAMLPPDTIIPCAALRSSIPPSQPAIPIVFQSLEVGTHFFRSVYIAVQDTLALSALHTHVHSALGPEPRTPAFPHLSLCYITDEDAESGEREMFYQGLKRGRYRTGAEAIGINCAESEEGEEWLFGFEASEVWVTKCEGPVEDWVVLERIPLHSLAG